MLNNKYVVLIYWIQSEIFMETESSTKLKKIVILIVYLVYLFNTNRKGGTNDRITNNK